MLDGFDGILKCLASGAAYRSLPPRGPSEHLPTLTDEELEALKQPVDSAGMVLGNTYAYDSIALADSDYRSKLVPFPSADEIRDLTVQAIDGSNQRLDHASFHFVLARAALVKFHYRGDPRRPYTGVRHRDHAAVVLVDANVFEDGVMLHVDLASASPGKELSLLSHLESGKTAPLAVRFDAGTADKNPKSHALGWAVKLQQALELWMLGQVTDSPSIVIRDGPLFSTSVSPLETRQGLSRVFGWTDRTLLSVSKRVGDSTMLVQALLQMPALRDAWFPGQSITDSTLRGVPSDTILLPRVLRPGERTPWFEAVPRARVQVVKDEPRLAPLACYYLSKNRPHNFIRIEVPRFMWDADPESVERALRVVAWQHELGQDAPLVQLHADRSCQLQSEIQLLRRRTRLELARRALDLPEAFE